MLQTTSIVIVVALSLIEKSASQDSSCSKYFRNVHRMGANVGGRLEIPTDDLYPKYKLRISFSSPIHHMAFRQLRAKDTGTHREFTIDPMEMQTEGKLKLDIFIRLHRALGRMSRMTRIVYNNVALCGDSVTESEFDGSVSVALTTLPTTRPVPILVPVNDTTKTKDYEDEEDIF